MIKTDDINDFINDHTKIAYERFNEEISTDENKDYRRGYRAGVLFSYLHIKANLAKTDFD